MNQPNARPIICGIDFSEPAQYAANVAVPLAKRLGTRLVLVHGVDERGEIPRHYWPRCMAEDRPHLTAEAARLRELDVDVQEDLAGGVPDEGVAKSVARRGGGRECAPAPSAARPRGHRSFGARRARDPARLHPAEADRRGIRSEVQVVENGDAAAGICEAADRFDADLICIGSHGHSSLLAAAMGSVAYAVIARSCRPVLVVRPPSS